jgi:multidrug transporter EmrE-like cation transporter
MRGIPLGTGLLFAAAVIAQVISVALLPRTLGFHHVPATLACLIAFDVSLWLCARLSQGGMNLGLLIPAMSALVPLASIVVGIVVYHEPAVVPRIALLVAACGLIGIASAL